MAAEALAARDMHHGAWPAAGRVPTLTEVVELDSLFPATAMPPTSAAAASALSAEVLFELEQRIGPVLEGRLRDALAPALARAADLLIRDAKQELAQALRELVDESVTRALERRTHP